MNEWRGWPEEEGWTEPQEEERSGIPAILAIPLVFIVVIPVAKVVWKLMSGGF